MNDSYNLDKVDKLASQCVKCALCLPHCPTYQITEDENESPRGRIALFQALSQDKLPLTEKVQKHLDQCLGCRACEAVCPAHVKYGELLVAGRANWHKSSRLLISLIENRHCRRVLHSLLWILDASQLRKIARKLGLIKLLGLSAWDQLLPTVEKPRSLSSHYPALSKKRGSVMLFIGCTTPWSDQQTLSASIHVLRRWGFDVNIPPSQTCCGAMAMHAGFPEKALKLAKENEYAFHTSIDHIITLATGCSATLQEYDPTQYPFAKKIIDIMDFLNTTSPPDDLAINPLPLRVKLHTPCSRSYVLKTPLSPLQVLKKIPQLMIDSFENPSCCGAAGTYMLEHPKMAESLVDKLLAEIKSPLPNYVASSNIGCALHLRREIHQRNLAIEVGHPVMLLARALDF
jgi:glycolate oxidase iron-sulfur subunit